MPDKSPAVQKKNSHICPFDGFSCAYPCFKLKQSRMQAGMADDEVAKELGVSRATWWRYRQGHQRPPRSVCSYLHIRTGHLPWPGWTKCFVNHREGKLYIDDYQIGLSKDMLRSYWWNMQLMTVLKGKVKQQEKRIDELSWFEQHSVKVVS